MKSVTAAFALVLGGCSTMPWAQEPTVSESTCTASCNAHFAQCPQIFAGFPETGAVECPAEHNNCLKACATHHSAARPAAMPAVELPPGVPPAPAAASPPPQAISSPVRAASSKEAQLRELKHLYDEGLVTDDVYRDRQKAILSEP
jgi:hypothetical protein